jgi:hypothetical protein
MKFDAALQALVHMAWDWTEEGFETTARQLGLERERDADPELPAYTTPWGKDWAQAIIEDGNVVRLEVLVEAKSPAWRPFTARKLAALVRKFRDKHDAYVRRIAAIKGTPKFVGDADASGFPTDEDALRLALWPAENARLMLILRNEGPDTPVWISIVLRPPAIGRSPTSRPSTSSLHAPPRRPSTSAVFRPGTARPATSVSDASPLDARFAPALEAIASIKWRWSSDALPAPIESIRLPATASTDPQRVQFLVEKASPPPGGFTDDEMEAIDQDYCEKLERYVDAAKAILGKPKFYNGNAARGFPKDERAELLALWQLKTARVMVMYCNDGEDEPYTISIVVKPR